LPIAFLAFFHASNHHFSNSISVLINLAQVYSEELAERRFQWHVRTREK